MNKINPDSVGKINYIKNDKKANKLKYSNLDKGLNWWNFRIEKMSIVERYFFVGLTLTIPTLLGFFTGLVVDFLLQQEAIIALYGIAIGTASALVITYYQLNKLVDHRQK